MALDYDMLMGLPGWTVRQTYTARDTMLYALGVGCGSNPDELAYVYEDGLQALPTMAAVLAYPGFWYKEPRYRLDWRKVLHGEQWVRMHRPLPVAATLRGEMRIEEILDKGAEKGAVLYWTRELFDDASGEVIATVRGSAFLRGDGGFGGTPDGGAKPRPVPDRPADAVVEIGTRPEQALIYRLSGDYNPLHVDPVVARAGGFDRPILHGLCTYGVAGRAIVRERCGGQASKLRQIDARFSAPVYPGETLRVEIWDAAPGAGAFRCSVVERGLTVLNNGWFEHD